MLIAVIGGKLQGVEAVYLAKKAGFQTLVIDKNPAAPAAGLGDQFMVFEFNLQNRFPQDTPPIDVILPAIENDSVLSALKAWSDAAAIPLIFDPRAYSISSSKRKSDTLFQAMHLPVPKYWPDCGFPVVAKPDQASGSVGVEIIDNATDLAAYQSAQMDPNKIVIQEFLEGPSYSVEVLGKPGDYWAIQITDLGMDKGFDCNKVTAPTQLPAKHIRRFKEMAVAIAEEVGLVGIMDVEAILCHNELQLLEIDARLPSQTPMAVYWSTGINMVELLCHLVLNKKEGAAPGYERPVLLEHIKVCGPEIFFLGEHIMAEDGPLYQKTDFFGADEAITSFNAGKSIWVATLIFYGASQDEINRKRTSCHDKIMQHIQASGQ